MTKVLRSAHAEDVGNGLMVEPGQEIPADADPERVKRLETRGLVEQTKGRAKSKPKSEEE